VPLKDRVRFLKTAEDVDAFLEACPKAVVFKAGACHKTQDTFARVEGHLEAHVGLAVGVIRVVESRAASQRVVEITGIRHESPQIVLFSDRRAVFERNNWSITSEAVGDALQDHFAEVPNPREVVS